ncbi:MAG: T9SS type A sorting domain-containing protein [FCB group bacterium]|nr:T9SS type A sorting domain-containing protein [FCB group bacterium]
MHGGGLYFQLGSGGYVSHCLLTENSSNAGGAIHLGTHPGVEIINSTITSNFADDRGGGVFTASFSYPILKNCIIYGNGASDSPNMYSAGDDSFRISYSDIERGWFGEENIDADPLFSDPQNNDYSLSWMNYPAEDSTKSPCIDAGDPESPIDPDNTTADMGCYYFHQISSPILEISDDTLDFGEVFVGDTSALLLILYNSGEVDVVIDSIVSTDPASFFSDWENLDSLILPRDSLCIYVFFAPEENSGYQEFLQIFSNSEPLNILLTGEGVVESYSDNYFQTCPSEFLFNRPFPNPFNSAIVISFALPASGALELKLFDINGRKISTLLEGNYSAGFYEVNFDASGLSAGIYFIRITWSGNSLTHKIVLLK